MSPITVQRIPLRRWHWYVDLGDGTGVGGWTFTKRAANRAARREWGMRRA